MTMGPGAIATFLYYFATTTLIMTILSLQFGLAQEFGVPLSINPIIGLVGGTMGAYFNRSVTISMPFKNRKTFQRELDSILAEMGYSCDRELDDWLVYRRPTIRQLFSGKIYVKLDDGLAMLSSRSVHIQALLRRLSDQGLA